MTVPRQPVVELRRGGPTTDPDILALRARQSRAMLTTLMLSFGVPLLLGGDEFGRTQDGNNNAYCQDNDDQLARLVQRRPDLLAVHEHLIALRRAIRCSAAAASCRDRSVRTCNGSLRQDTDGGGDWADPGRPGHRHLPRRPR